jgi:hypothetical protein
MKLVQAAVWLLASQRARSMWLRRSFRRSALFRDSEAISGSWVSNLYDRTSYQNVIEWNSIRHRQNYSTRSWIPWALSRSWADDTWIPPDVGDLLHGVRRDQGLLWRASYGQYREPEEPTIPSSTSQGIPASHAGAPVGAAHYVRHGSRSCELDLYESTLGH